MSGGGRGGLMDTLSAELVARLAKESTRAPTAAGTELVGGVVRAAGKLEDLLQELARVIAEFEAIPTQRLLAIEGPPGRPFALDKATAGVVARGLRRWYERRGPESAPVFARVLVRDLFAEPSAIRAFITLRNAVAHAEADPAESRAASRALSQVIAAFRSDNSWD